MFCGTIIAMAISLTPQELEEKLKQVFTPEQAASLIETLDPVQQVEINRADDTQELEQGLGALVEVQTRTEKRLDHLTEIQTRTEAQLREMISIRTNVLHKVDRMIARLDRVVGFQLEKKYRDKAYAYFGRYLRRVRVISLQEIEDELSDRLSEQELSELIPLDLLIRGQPHEQPEGPEIWLAVEVSAVVDRHDVERAQRWATLLRKAGYRVIPTVAGEEVTTGGEDMARDYDILLIQNGRAQFWPEAMATALQNHEH